MPLVDDVLNDYLQDRLGGDGVPRHLFLVVSVRRTRRALLSTVTVSACPGQFAMEPSAVTPTCVVSLLDAELSARHVSVDVSVAQGNDDGRTGKDPQVKHEGGGADVLEIVLKAPLHMSQRRRLPPGPIYLGKARDARNREEP